MKVFSWNINGLRAVIRKGSLKAFLDTHSPDILCLGETKINDSQVADEKIRKIFPDYTQYYSFAERKGYSGTSIWIRNSSFQNATTDKTESPSIKMLEDKGLDPLDEGRITVVELSNLFVISIYVPNSKDDLSRLKVRQDWDKDFLTFCQDLQKIKPIIVCGDMNVAKDPIDLARPKENEGKHGYTTEERDGFSSLLDNVGLIDTFRKLHPTTVKYSWWSHWGHARERNIGWRIDYILASKTLSKKITSAEIYPGIMGSDHCPISITLED